MEPLKKSSELTVLLGFTEDHGLAQCRTQFLEETASAALGDLLFFFLHVSFTTADGTAFQPARFIGRRLELEIVVLPE
jgi:glycerol uptake facilitator-like aquaporin